MYKFQRTIKSSISFSGIGLHTGEYSKITLLPSEADTGVVFVVLDQGEKIEIKASFENVVDTNRGTTLGNGKYKIYTVEHLLSAVYAHGIDNLYIEINNIEPPILDGSSIDFYNGILNTGIKKFSKKKNIVVIDKPIYFLDSKNDVEISILPYDGFKISFNADFNYGSIKKQSFVFDDIKNYLRDISPARTFCSFDELYYLKTNNLIKGASLDNGIVYMNDKTSQKEIKKINKLFNIKVKHNKNDKTLNGKELRFEDEAVRHKILDLIGDFSLFNNQISGHIISNKSGHFTNIEFLKKLKKEINSNVKYSFDKKEIQQVIPHRYPFLLIDNIIDVNPGKRVIAQKKFDKEDYFLEGHFPKNPIVPGVIIVECMAQASCFLSLNLVENRKEKMMLLSNIKNAKFINKVTINEMLVIEVDLIKFRLNTALFYGVAKVENDIVAKAEFLATVVNKDD